MKQATQVIEVSQSDSVILTFVIEIAKKSEQRCHANFLKPFEMKNYHEHGHGPPLSKESLSSRGSSETSP